MSDLKQFARAVAHDACREGDRTPVGAVPAGAEVRLRLRVDDLALGIVESADVLVLERGAWHELRMDRCDGGFGTVLAPSGGPHVIFYVFRMDLVDGDQAYYVPSVDGRSTAGDVVVPEVDGEWTDGGWAYADELAATRPGGDFGLPWVLPGFQVTTYEPGFQTPDWMAGAVMYQIFPDRFARGSDGVRKQGVAYHEKMGRPVLLREGWDDPVYWIDDATYDPVDFYGGTLQGIREKLPYLASLGVEVVYLNPVFEARSNHRYDTADYERIDPLLGDEDDLRELVEEGRRCGIAFVFDAVLSHTGNDSRYFNALGDYEEPGALQGPESPYFDWYDITVQEDGSVGYRSWWGFPTLPEVVERRDSWQRYMLGSDDIGDGSRDDVRGVLPKWIEGGVRGYRLDVADEIPDDVLAKIRESVKRADSEAAIIGEVWEDATTKLGAEGMRNYALGFSLDSVMNYPLRSVLLGFALGKLDAWQLASFLRMQQANYPEPMYRCLMNLLSSHDVERVRSVLALGRSIRNLPRTEQREMVEGITAVQDRTAARLQRMTAGLLYALPGMPCVYYGDERGLQGGRDPFCRATFPWDGKRVDCGLDVTKYYRKLGEMRKTSQVLRRGECRIIALGADAVCVVRYIAGGQATIAVANRAQADCSFAIDFKDIGVDATVSSHPLEDGIVTGVAPACATTFFD